MKVVFVDVDRCIACLNCVRACSFQQEAIGGCVDPNIFVHVDLEQRRIFTNTCLQCRTALCMKVCPARALSRDPRTQAIVVNKDLCIGCAMCVSVCPFGSVHLDEVRRVASKCDLCSGRPRCVQVCMAKALHYGSINQLAELKRRRKDLRLVVRAVIDDGESGR
jgi:carbon-monoxide dehydrogenase iron sulfur subunit